MVVNTQLHATAQHFQLCLNVSHKQYKSWIYCYVHGLPHPSPFGKSKYKKKKTPPQCFPELVCITSPVITANTEIQKYRQFYPDLYN